jgi:hypothetical protein
MTKVIREMEKVKNITKKTKKGMTLFMGISSRYPKGRSWSGNNNGAMKMLKIKAPIEKIGIKNIVYRFIVSPLYHILTAISHLSREWGTLADYEY